MSVLLQGDQLRALLLGVKVSRATDTLPQTATEDLFSIDGGRVLITSLVGEITTVIQTQANNTKLTFDPDSGGSDVDLCAVLDISADAVGDLYTITGTLATAMQTGDEVLAANQVLQSPLVLTPGDIKLNCAASNTGSVKWDLTYIPLDAGASVTAV